MEVNQVLEKLLKSYAHYYDVERDVDVADGHFAATAFYHQRDEQQLLGKNRVLDVMELHEYVYFLTADHLDLKTLEEQIRVSREAGMSHIVPNRNHRCTMVTMVILANTIDPEAVKRIKKERFRKNFRLALHGWMEYHIAAMECSTESFFSNPAGKEARKNLERNFSSKAK